LSEAKTLVRRETMSKRMAVPALLVVAFLALPIPALADPITYIYTGTGSGILGGVAFVDASFTITALADTDNITAWASAAGGPQNTHLSTTIDIDGLGLSTILTPSHTWLDPWGGYGGLGANLWINWATLSTTAWVGYGLDTAIGPILADSIWDVYGFRAVSTSGGALLFSGMSRLTFEAVTAGTAAVPEPATLLLLGIGLVAAGLARPRRRRP